MSRLATFATSTSLRGMIEGFGQQIQFNRKFISVYQPGTRVRCFRCGHTGHIVEGVSSPETGNMIVCVDLALIVCACPVGSHYLVAPSDAPTINMNGFFFHKVNYKGFYQPIPPGVSFGGRGDPPRSQSVPYPPFPPPDLTPEVRPTKAKPCNWIELQFEPHASFILTEVNRGSAILSGQLDAQGFAHIEIPPAYQDVKEFDVTFTHEFEFPSHCTDELHAQTGHSGQCRSFIVATGGESNSQNKAPLFLGITGVMAISPQDKQYQRSSKQTDITLLRYQDSSQQYLNQQHCCLELTPEAQTVEFALEGSSFRALTLELLPNGQHIYSQTTFTAAPVNQWHGLRQDKLTVRQRSFSPGMLYNIFSSLVGGAEAAVPIVMTLPPPLVAPQIDEANQVIALEVSRFFNQVGQSVNDFILYLKNEKQLDPAAIEKLPVDKQQRLAEEYVQHLTQPAIADLNRYFNEHEFGQLLAGGMLYLGNDSSGGPVYQMQRGAGNTIFTNDVIIFNKTNKALLVYHEYGLFLQAVNLDGNTNPVLSRIYQGSKLRWSNDNQQNKGAGLVVSVGLDDKFNTPTHTGGNQILEPGTIVNHTGGDQIVEQLPAHTGGDQIADSLPTNTGGDQILDLGLFPSHTGSDVEPVYLPDYMIKDGDNRLPVPKPTVASNGLTLRSNTKHTPGALGFGFRAGIEPRNSLELFEQSIALSTDGDSRYTRDSQGNIHRFSDGNDGTYHWSGSTGDKRNPLDLHNRTKSILRKELGWEIK